MSTASDHAEALAKVDLFAGLSHRQLGKLADVAREVSFQAGHAVTAEGEGSLALHVILDGSASVTQGGTHLRDLGAGDYFGEISMIDGQPRSATVEATSAMRTLAIRNDVLDGVLDKDAEVAKALLRGLCARLREAESRA